ncbi:MAG: M48 family metallopeptidase [Lentisphaerae bacterium]|nr:M48 family metallopeptidase [Lentisphaerota bacterium]
MDFYGHQDSARKRTGWLVVLYGLAVVGIALALYIVVRMVFGGSEAGEPVPDFWQPELFFGVTVGVVAVVLAGSLFKTAQLSGGGPAVARSLGGRPVLPNTTDPDERRLLNVVEEMALAAGVSVPQVYMLDAEDGINAFAAGFSTRDAIIGVTRGCVRQLTRDELQGVIAHEFSHIVNGDMRLNIRLIGVLFGILMITVIGQIIFRTTQFSGGGGRSRDNKRGGNPLPLLGLAMIIIGYIGVFFANLIKSAVSRQREFLADASAVQYTRNPSGIAGALKRIGGFAAGAKVRNAHASEASHLFFGDAIGSSLMSLFATHPPLKERIRRLDPASNPQIAAWAASAPSAGAAPAAVSGFAAGRSAGAGTVDLAAAQSLLATVPKALREAARDPVAARTLIYALLRAARSDVRARQDQAMLSLDPQAESRLAALAAATVSLPAALRLPLAELAIPTLKILPRADYQVFRRVMQIMTEADDQIDLFEYALQHLIVRHVEPAFGKVSAAPIRYRTVDQVLPACRTVMTALAAWGTESREAAAAAFEEGMRTLEGQSPAYDAARTSLGDVDLALNTLSEASPQVKKKVIEACTRCVLADGQTAPNEADLLRAIADAMDVPMPPVAAG